MLKVESAVRVDFLRQVGVGGYMDVNNCPTFNQLNLGTRSIAVDLSNPDGLALIRRFAVHCDLIMENMRAPVIRKWGLDYASARTLRDDAIVLSSQGFGAGPYGDYQTYGPNLQTFSGVTSQWAHPDDPYPVGTTLPHPDHIAGKQALVPLLAALLRRQTGGGGCFIEAAQVERPAYLIGHRFLQEQLAGVEPTTAGNTSPDMAPHGCYRCADDAWIAIAVENDRQWQALAALIDAADEPAFATVEARITQAARLDPLIAAWTTTRDGAALEATLRAAGVPASRVLTGDDLAADKAHHERGFFAPVGHPTSGTRTYTGAPVFANVGARPRVRRAPLLGEHTDTALLDVLGIDAVDAARLYRSRAIGH